MAKFVGSVMEFTGNSPGIHRSLFEILGQLIALDFFVPGTALSVSLASFTRMPELFPDPLLNAGS